MESDAQIGDWLAEIDEMTLLRFITCGSVDDGKSTLIGRLLYESKRIFDDQLANLERDSKTHGTQGDNIDFALLVDGLAAEREQGITIDVAYRYFATERRKFIVADAPGHAQYTRNMATAASTAELAILLVDARHGLLTQTHRHAYIAALLGIRQIVLAVNKMDLVDYDRDVFDRISAEFATFAESLPIDTLTPIPISARDGDNVVKASKPMGWYDGVPLLAHLETAPIGAGASDAPMRLPVQWINRPDADFRGASGQLASGTLEVGARVAVRPGDTQSVVARIVTADGDLAAAQEGRSITITLADDVDISRGSILCSADDPADVADQFEAVILWMDEDPMLPGRPYRFKLATQTAIAGVHAPKYRIDTDTLEEMAARTLELNEIGVCTLALDRPVAFDPYDENRATGGFILIDRITHRTVGAGFLKFALHRATNLHRQTLAIDAAAHAEQKGQKPAILWFTGLSGSGKSTIANALQKELFALGRHSMVLDGDNVRHGLNRDLGFKDADRVENIRRVAEVAKLMLEAGLFPLVSFISPFRAERRLARELVAEGEFIEIHIDTPLDVAEARDPKGLYKKARAGDIANFTGLDSPYEPPENPEIVIDTTTAAPEEAVAQIMAHLRAHGHIE